MTQKKGLPLPGKERRTILVSYLIDQDEADLLDRNKGRFEKRNIYCRRAALEAAAAKELPGEPDEPGKAGE